MSVCTCSFSFKITTSQKRLKSTVCIRPRRAIPASSDNRTSEQTSNRPKRTMISPRTVYFVYFALIFGTPPAKAIDNNNTTPIKPTDNNNTTPIEPTDNNTTPIKPTDNNNTIPIKPTDNNNTIPIKPTDNKNTTPIRPTDNKNTTPVKATDNNNNTTPVNRTETSTTINDKNGTTATSNNNRQTTKLNSAVTTNKPSVCTQTTPKPKEGHCIFSLPTGEDNLVLIVVALTVGCLALLLTTLIGTCQVCHLRGIISSLQHHNDNIDQHAVREKSESPCRDEGQVDGQPTETCLMLSEVTAAQEESREDEVNNSEPCTEPPVKDPNGDVTQKNSLEPDAKAPENSDPGV